MANNVTDIAFTDVVDNSDTTGYFNELMASIKGHINGEYQAGRIIGNDYANVFLGSMQYAMNNAIQYALQQQVQNQQAELLAAQTTLTISKGLTETKQQTVLDKQATLYVNQAKAFEGKHNKELLKILTDTWVVAESETLVDNNASTAFGENINGLIGISKWSALTTG